MKQGDFDEFARLIDSAYDMIGGGNKTLSVDGKTMFFRAVSKYPLDVFRAALGAHIASKEGRFVPLPAHINEQVSLMIAQDGRPGAEEAWAIALTGKDEQSTVVWTQEIAAAMSICRPVLDSSGAISARKPFLDAYTRLVGEARAAHRPAEWVASVGWDKARQATAINGAVNAGRLPAPVATALLEGPNSDPTPDDAARAQLAAIKLLIKEGAALKAAARLAEAERLRLVDEEWKLRTDAQVRQALGQS